MIELEHISKTFRVAKRNAGMGEAVRALFRREYTLVRALRTSPSKSATGRWSAT